MTDSVAQWRWQRNLKRDIQKISNTNRKQHKYTKVQGTETITEIQKKQCGAENI